MPTTPSMLFRGDYKNRRKKMKNTTSKIKQYLPHSEVARLFSTHPALLMEMAPFIVIDGKDARISIDEVLTAPYIPEAGVPTRMIVLKVTTDSGEKIVLRKEPSDSVFFYKSPIERE